VAGIDDFLAFLRDDFGRGAWDTFDVVAERREQIGVHRPFYPYRPGGTRRRHLVDGLGLGSEADLLRVSERATESRRAACPLFWTLGGNQVGKAALAGWRQVIAPALRLDGSPVAIWPFGGDLFALIATHTTVVAETYPAEYYLGLGIDLGIAPPGERPGKRSSACRRANARALLDHIAVRPLAVSEDLERAIRSGFGEGGDGEDPFDALVGLLGMIEVVLHHRLSGEPSDAGCEGWILGQAAQAGDHIQPGRRSPVDITAAHFADVSAAELDAAPTNYAVGTSLLLENERVRIWDITLAPGERTPFHCHRSTYFYRCESGGRWRVRTLEGDVMVGEDAPGEVTFHELELGERLVHELANVGEDVLRYTTVELLDGS
jgi:hypothetical protein